MSAARAVACSNIALAKYWGKADARENLPAVPSLSLTLDALTTTTTVDFGIDAPDDEVVLDGSPAIGRARERVIALLDRVRKPGARARVVSTNDFPTAAGLASSASGFAALALAALRASGKGASLEEASALARASSASAARSVYGGFASLAARGHVAERVAPPDHFPVVMIVAVTALGPKDVGSTEAMNRTSTTSPYYSAWVSASTSVFERVRSAVIGRDLVALGTAMEESALMMHASMLAARPAVRYFTPATIAAMDAVRDLREHGVHAYFTIDGGPHVKVLTESARAAQVIAALAATPGVLRTIECRPGADARVEAL